MIAQFPPIVLFILRTAGFIAATLLGTYIHWQSNKQAQQKKAWSNNITFDDKTFHEREKTARNMDIAANVFIFLCYLTITFNYSQKWQWWWPLASYVIGGAIGFGGSFWIIKVFGVTQKWMNEKISKQTGQQIDNNPEN